MLSGRGLGDELITRPEESYRMCCVVVCDLETSRMGAPYIYDISRLRVKLFSFVGTSLMAYTIAHFKGSSAETSSCFRQNSLRYTSDKYRTVLSSGQVSFKDTSCNLNGFIGISTYMRCQINPYPTNVENMVSSY